MKEHSSMIQKIANVLIIFVLFSSFLPANRSQAAAGIRYTTPDGTGECSSWATACTLQTALTGAVSGDEIWAEPGAYKPTTETEDRSATFQLIGGVAIYGGFAGNETAADSYPYSSLTTEH